jgi:hypothetical protein
MGDIRRYWGCDHAPGRGNIIQINGGAVPNFLYFEMRIVQSTAGSKVCIGLANAGFNVSNPVSLDLSAGVYTPALDGGCFMSFGNPGGGGNINYWSGGTATPTGTFPSFSNLDWIGVAVDRVNHLAWWHNASNTPGTWAGGSGTPDPVTGTDGYDYNTNAAMSGTVYILAGGGNEDVSSPVPEGSLNLGQFAFVSPPAGYSPWQTTGAVLNPLTAAAEMVLFDANDESFTQTAITGSNQPTAFALSVKGY